MSESVWLYIGADDDFVFSVHRTEKGAKDKYRRVTESLAERGANNIKIRFEQRDLEP